MPIEGFEPYRPEDAAKYEKYRWWLGLTWGDIFDKATDIYPYKQGLVDDTARFTYRELREKVDRLAVGFIDLGIKRRDFVLLQIPTLALVHSRFLCSSEDRCHTGTSHRPTRSCRDQTHMQSHQSGGMDRSGSLQENTISPNPQPGRGRIEGTEAPDLGERREQQGFHFSGGPLFKG